MFTLKPISIGIAFFCLVLSSASFADVNNANEIRLLSLNVWQFAYGIESTHDEERADKLATIINQRHNEFDVIAFQELWSNVTRDHIYKHIHEKYPYKFEDEQWGFLGIGFHSGLAIYSKYPIHRTVQHTYNHYRGLENLAKKGLMGVELIVQGKPLYVFTTHLQAGDGGSFFRWWDRGKPLTTEITILQLREARKVIDAFVQDKQAPNFFIGDFNIRAGDQEYQNGLDALAPVRDSFDQYRSQFFCTTWGSFPGGSRIDYIMVLNSDLSGYSTIVDFFNADVTDHLGVVGIFNLPGR